MTSLHRWYREFSRDCSSLQDEFLQGRWPKAIDDVRKMIFQDRYVT